MMNVWATQEIHLRDYFYILRKRRRVFFLFIIVTLLIGIFFTRIENVLFRSTATILVERENPNIVDFQEVMSLDASTSDYYQTQYEMIKSRSLIERLIREHNLEEDPFIRGIKEGGLQKMIHEQKNLPSWIKEAFGQQSLPDLFIKNLLRVDPVRNTRLVRISILHADSGKAADLANGLVDLFIQQNLESRFLVSQRASELLTDQISEMKIKVEDAEKKLQNYKELQGLVNIPSIHEKDRFIEDAKLELVKIQAEEGRIGTRYLPAHPKRIHIRSQIESLEQKIEEELTKTLALSRKAIEYAQLEREALSARQIYEVLLSRLEETHNEAKMQASNIIIVDSAQPLSKPFKPRPVLNFIIALFVGLIGGTILSFFFEYLDSTVKIPDDIEKGLGFELLGIIPQAEKQKKTTAGKGELFVSDSQHTPTSEAFRALRTALLFKMRHSPKNCRRILVTSPNPDEGKSTVVLNLTAAFQQNHLKVLLIDGDLRRPRLHHVFDLQVENGLTDILEGHAEFDAVVHRNVADLGIDFLSCGTPSRRPTELLGSSQMDQLLAKLEPQYDLVIFDSPPFLAVADVAVLSELSDVIIVVARYHKTEKGHLRDVKRRFSDTASKVFGVVMNQVSVREKDYYFHQYYYYGYGNVSEAK